MPIPTFLRLSICLPILAGCAGRVATRSDDGGGDAALARRGDAWGGSIQRERDAGGIVDVSVTSEAVRPPDAFEVSDVSALPEATAIDDATGHLDAPVDAGNANIAPLLCSPDAAIPDADVLGYMPVTQQLGACSPAALSAYIDACYSTASTQAMCDAWYGDTANGSCIGCLIPTDHAGHATNSGGLLVDVAGEAWTANVPGCFALVDPKDGPACAEVWEPDEQCAFQACGGCTTVSAADSCHDEIGGAGAACSGYDLTPCNAYLTDAGISLAACATPTAVIDVICGAGP